MAKVTICFTLDSDQDHDLLRWLDGLPKRGRSEAIRGVLRAHLRGGGVTLGDVYQAIIDLKRSGFAVPVGSGTNTVDDEPPDLAAALDNLGL